MLQNKLLPRLRSQSPSALPLAFGVAFGILICAMSPSMGHAQGQVQAQNSSDTDTFASSSQGLVAEANPGASSTGESSSLSFAAPTAASPAAGQSDNSYGYHHNNGILSKLTIEGGGGVNAPIGNDQPFITWGGNFTVGGGLRFTKRLSLLAEYQFMDDKLPGGLVGDAGANGGHAHIWSLTLDPVIDLFPARKNGAYITGGGGFYRKVTSFTDPEEVEECYYFCTVGVENVVVSHFSSNQGGANIGVGITHKIGGDERAKVFAEARYVWINTPQIGEQDGLGRTELLPVTLGIRW